MQRAIGIIFVMVFVLIYSSSVLATDVQLITTDQLNSSLNNSDIVVLDARGSWDWVKTDDKIFKAIRVDPGNVNAWANNFDKGKTIVLYCA
jgi:rhodanese-related sulfurtransferase